MYVVVEVVGGLRVYFADILLPEEEIQVTSENDGLRLHRESASNPP
jgi:hypothetical protein